MVLALILNSLYFQNAKTKDQSRASREVRQEKQNLERNGEHTDGDESSVARKMY